MPPDISTGPTALVGGTPPRRASGLIVAGPPGSDPLAALFAAFLAQSDGSPPLAGAAVLTLKAALKPNAPAKTDGKPADTVKDVKDKSAGDKTSDTALSAALATLPPLLTPIQMRPIQMRPPIPPTAGVSVGQEATGQKTMDTSPAPASPVKERADVKPGGELPLQGARMDTSGASAPFPAFLIALPTPPVVPPVDRATALPGTVPVASPGVLGAAAPAAAFLGVPSPPAMVKFIAASYVPQPQGLLVPTDVVLGLTKLPMPMGETVAAAAPLVTPPVPTPAEGTGQALPNAAQALILTLPQSILAAAGQTMIPGEAHPRLLAGVTAEASSTARVPSTAKVSLAAPLLAEARGVTVTNELTVTDGKVAKEGENATDGRAATDGTTATDGKAATEGTIAMEGKMLEGKMLTAVGTPETGLKSAALPADTNTRGQAVPAKTLPMELRLQGMGKRSERRTDSAGNDALPLLPASVPAQAETARTEAKPLTAADRAEMIRQVADGVGAMPLPAKAGGSEQMTLQLHPRDWGQLQISVKITPGADPNMAQAVTAHIIAETPQVKAALENHSGDLRQALREAGLHLDRISVTVQRMEASAQAGTATSGGHHGGNHGGTDQGRAVGAFGEAPPEQLARISERTGMSSGTGMSGASGNGLPSFAAHAGSHGGRQGGQPPPAYAAAYAPVEPEREDVSQSGSPRRLAAGQVDTRA